MLYPGNVAKLFVEFFGAARNPDFSLFTVYSVRKIGSIKSFHFLNHGILISDLFIEDCQNTLDDFFKFVALSEYIDFIQ